jgi:hypothetical protein
MADVDSPKEHVDSGDVGLALLGFAAGSMDALAFFNLGEVFPSAMTGNTALPAFRKMVDALVQGRRDAAETPAWFQQTYPQSPLSCIAYFSMEFMLSEARRRICHGIPWSKSHVAPRSCRPKGQ